MSELLVTMSSDSDDAIKLLDHGLIRLVDHMGSDLSIVRSARVSYDAAWRAGEDDGSDRKLINYLMKNRHTTPFESVQFTFLSTPFFALVRKSERLLTQAGENISCSACSGVVTRAGIAVPFRRPG